MNRYVAGIIAIVFLLVAGCFKSDKWEGVVYPDRGNMLMRKESGIFKSLDECKSASMAMLESLGAVEKGYFVCGHNCSNTYEMTCEEVYKGNLYR